MLDIWSVKTGHNLGQYNEREITNIPLPIKPNNNSGIDYNLISGKLPPGLRLKNNNIIGTPLEVNKLTTFEFCIRAKKNNLISDRTFKITIDGSDEPIVITKPGLLPVGPNQTYFVLDSTPVDFQLEVIDFDTAAGQKIRFYISSGDGELPPGLTLSNSGQIKGFIDPLLAVPYDQKNGNFDNQGYDSIAFDYGITSDNGFDSFSFDSVIFDYSAPLRGLRKLNRNYEFITTITDGDTFIKRKFRIYVVGEDYLKADNTVMKVGNNSYLASNTSLKTPIWLTPSNLGLIRANNYHIVKLDIYNTLDIGPVQYYFNQTNPDGSASVLPPGMKLDIKSGEIFGLIPYQPDVIKTYHFTVTVTRFGNDNETAAVPRTFTLKILGEADSTMSWVTPSLLGDIDANYISTLKVEADSTLTDAVISYSIVNGQLPPGLVLESNGEIIGKIQQYTTADTSGITTFYDEENGVRYSNQTLDDNETSIDKSYKFIIRAYDQTNYSAIDREFTLIINTPNDRLYSNIFVTTYMQLDKRSLFSNFINNESVFPQKNIYRVSDPNFGIRKDLRILIYAGIETVAAGEYISIIGLNHEKKRLLFGDVKIAKAKNPGTNNVIYEVIYIEMKDSLDTDSKHLPLKLPKLNPANRTITADMSNYLWKTEDKDFYISKREPFSPRPFESMTIDRTSVLASDPRTTQRFPNTIWNWRQRIKYHQDVFGKQLQSETNYLPLWMRSFQDNKEELGYTLALPLCYCKPNMSDEVFLNIKNYILVNNFDFKNLDYTIDRYIIDSVEGYGNDKYLVFKTYEAVI